MFRTSHFCYAALVIVCFDALSDEVSNEVTALLEKRAALGVLLSDGDAIAFGVADFDPNKLLGTNTEGFGNESTINERRNKAVYILPYTHSISSQNVNLQHQYSYALIV